MNTFASPIRRAETCFAERPALVDIPSGVVHSFGEVAARARRIVALLHHLGLQQGERVAVLAEGSPRYAELYQAVPMGGFVLVTLNSRYTLAELEAACNDCAPRVLFTDRAAEGVASLAPLVLPMGPELDGMLVDPPTPTRWEVDEDDPAVVFYTGGTTDRAKGVVLSHRSKLADALSLITSVDLHHEDRWLVMSPMFHAAGSFNILPCVWVGSTQYFLPRFDADAALRAIESYRLTITFGVPTMLPGPGCRPTAPRCGRLLATTARPRRRSDHLVCPAGHHRGLSHDRDLLDVRIHRDCSLGNGRASPGATDRVRGGGERRNPGRGGRRRHPRSRTAARSSAAQSAKWWSRDRI